MRENFEGTMSGIDSTLPSQQHDLGLKSTKTPEAVLPASNSRRRPSQTRFEAFASPEDRQHDRDLRLERSKCGLND